MTSKYDLNARFIKKAQVYDDEIDLQNATQSESNTEIVVLNGEEIIYETIENQNKDLVILIISIVSFVFILIICAILVFINL